MAQVFHRSTNTISRVSIFGALFALAGSLWGLAAVNRSSYVTLAGVAREQPVPFSHRHHAGELGIDCRYCHTVVERSNKAAVPPAGICMNCHSTVKKDSDLLLPIRQAYAENEPVRWTRVTDLPDYVYFNHSAHVNAAIGCESCHGRIDQMVKVYQAKPLTMEWCINCLKNPAPYLRDPANVTKMGYKPAPNEGVNTLKKNQVSPPINCSTCHR